MQFGIFSVGDVTTDPTTGRTPSEAERIKAMVTIAAIRSASLGVRPVVGSVVTSPTLKTPNCITRSLPVLSMRAPAVPSLVPRIVAQM